MSKTVLDILRAQCDLGPERVAIIAADGRVQTFGGLCRQIEQIVAALDAHGVGRGCRVALAMQNGPEMLTAFLALACGGAVAPLHPAYTRDELDAALRDLNIDVLVAHGAHNAPARDVALARQMPVFDVSVDPAGAAGAFSLVPHRDDRDVRLPAAAGQAAGFAQAPDLALLLTTSGTTARPKVVPISHEALTAGARLMADALALAAADRYLCVMPLHHIHGLVTSLAALAAGGSVVASPPFEADHFYRCLEAYQPTWYSAAPALHQAIVARAGAFPAIVAASRLRLIRSSSASLPPLVMAGLEEVFRAPVTEGYGMTETCLYAANNPLPPGQRKMGSVGIARGVELAVLDADGRRVEAGATGEVALRGPNLISGYEHDAQANAEAFLDGWFRTGDQGYLDADGYLYLTGRLQERINRGGEKISPGEVEAVLLSHPEVAAAAAFAVPHPTLGEDLAAAVVLCEGSRSSPFDLRRFAAARLADHKVPGQILVVDRIPAGPTGKIRRRHLAQAFADRLRAEFVEPRNLLELEIADVWQEVLKLPPISVNDNFFRLGGDSIKATQVVSRMRHQLGLDVTIRDLFLGPTIAALAGQLADGTRVHDAGPQPDAVPSCAAQAPRVVAVGEPDGPSRPPEPPRGMDLGVFFFSAEDAPVDGDKYRLFLDSVRYADRQGFSAVWTPERHFHAFGGLYPNPSVLGAAAAMVTERLHIRAGSVVLPFQDPLRVAEEWSVVDNLSRGRVGIACASGWNVNDFVLAPASFERRRDLVAERIEIIRRLWRGEAVRLPNGAGQPVEVRIYPRPVQPTLPVWLAAHGDATFIKAGEIGAHVLTALIYTHPDDLARGIALYRKARARHGVDPAAGTVTLMLHTFVGRTMTQVEEHVMPAYEQYLRVNLGLKDERVLGGDQARRSDEDSRFIIARATEELFRTRGLVGTPDVCVERLAAFRRMGVDEVACLIDFGIPAAEVLDGLERLDGVRRAAASIGVTRPQPVGSVGG